MESNPEYLKYLINEEIYLVEDPVPERKEEVKKEVKPVSGKKNDNTPDEQAINISDKTFVLLDSKDRSPHDFLKDTFFIKVISAVNLTEKDLILIDLSEEEKTAKTLDKYRMKACNILAFSEELPAAYSGIFGRVKYNIQSIDGARVLWADPLSRVEQDRSLKLKLWEAMKVMYGIKS